MTLKKNKKILLTGFLPFKGEKINPSQLVVERQTPPSDLGFDAELTVAVLPVTYLGAVEKLRLLSMHQYDFVLMLGQGGGRQSLELERYAFNQMDSNSADEDGIIYRQQKINDQGGERLETRVDLLGLQQELLKDGIEVKISANPGRFVCNRVYYYGLEAGEKSELQRTLFVHLPFLPEQTVDKHLGKPSLSIEEMKKAIQVILVKCLWSN